MLGHDDTILYEYDEMLNLDSVNILAGKPTATVDDMFHGMVWKSYTWVLAAYELIRTIHQKLKTLNPSADITSKCKSLKNEFTRLRVPLAKFEPAEKHKSTDYKFPQGCIQPGRGLCWAVADGVVMSRMELSDALVSFLLELKSHQAAPSSNSGQTHA